MLSGGIALHGKHQFNTVRKEMIFSKSVLVALLSSTVLLSGCALVPGLRVSASGEHHGANPPYQVIDVTPEVISSLRKKTLASNAAEVESPSMAPIASGYSARVVPVGAAGLKAASGLDAPADYRIGPGDILQIVVWDHLELTNPFGAVTRDPVSSGQLVSADGTIFFPYVGVFEARGKTAIQVREYLAKNLAVVVKNPQVDVRVVAYRSSRVQVTGEVKNPGLVTLDDTTKGLLEALDERGGLSPAASRRTTLLIRGGKSYEINLAGLLSGNVPALNPLLEAGDIVHVPDANNDQVFVLGELARQGPVTMGQQELTLTEALTKSGGLDRLSANDSGVLVFRRPTRANESASIYALDLSRPEGLLLAGEFTLEARDVVYVKATAFTQYNLVIGQLLPTITAVYQVDALTQ